MAARKVVEEVIETLSKNPKRLTPSALLRVITHTENILDSEGAGDFAYDSKQKKIIGARLGLYCTEFDSRFKNP